MIRRDLEVQVIDSATGKDVTHMVLTQIIVEDAKEQPNGLPLELLRQLIVATDRAGKEFVMWYLKTAFDAYQQVRDSVETRLTDVRSAALSPLNLVRNLLGSAPAGADAELARLRARIAELETRTSAGQPRRKSRRRKKP